MTSPITDRAEWVRVECNAVLSSVVFLTGVLSLAGEADVFFGPRTTVAMSFPLERMYKTPYLIIFKGSRGFIFKIFYMLTNNTVFGI